MAERKEVTFKYEPVIKKAAGPLIGMISKKKKKMDILPYFFYITFLYYFLFIYCFKANFTNPPPLTVFENPEQLKLQCLRNSDSHKKKVLVASTDKIEYKGDNFTAAAGPARYLQHLKFTLPQWPIK